MTKAEAPTAEVPKSEYPYGVNTTTKNARGDKEFDLFVVHTNDIDGAFSGEAGGMDLAQLATLAKIGSGVTDNWLMFNTGSIGNVDDATALNVAKAFDEIGYSAYTPQTIQLASGVSVPQRPSLSVRMHWMPTVICWKLLIRCIPSMVLKSQLSA